MNWTLHSTNLSSSVAKDIKVSISGPAENISVSALSGDSSHAGIYNFEAIGYLPDGTTTSFIFDLEIGCSNPTISAPSHDASKTAELGSSTPDSYDVGAFTVSPSACTVTYSTSVTSS